MIIPGVSKSRVDGSAKRSDPVGTSGLALDVEVEILERKRGALTMHASVRAMNIQDEPTGEETSNARVQDDGRIRVAYRERTYSG